MKYQKFLATLTIACCIAVSPDLSAQANPEAEQIIEKMLVDLMSINRVPAHSVAIAMDGRVIAQVTVGEKDVRNHIAATDTTTFRLASVSKVVGATMLAKLVQDGSLDPDKPIGQYMPGLEKRYQALTTIQLLAHISGMPHYQSRDALIAATHYDSATQALAAVGDRSLLEDPGEAYVYSSHGYSILSALYEAITGKPLQQSVPEFVQQMVGRTTPALEDVTKRNSRRSNVFDLGPGGPVTLKQKDQSYSPFATGFIATAADLALFGDAVLSSSLINDETRDMLFDPVHLNDGSKTGNYLYEVAFGWRVGMDMSGRRVIHHAGITQGARSVLVIYPDIGLSIAFLSNARWTSQIERSAFSLANIVLQGQTAVMKNGRYKFSGTFNGEATHGYLDCDTELNRCYLVDREGALSPWLVRFNYVDSGKRDWPAIVTRSSNSYQIKLITSVGFVELQAAPQTCSRTCFAAELGDNRMLELQFEDQFLIPTSKL